MFKPRSVGISQIFGERNNMHVTHYIEIGLEALGALGLLCSALSKFTSGKTRDALAELGTNFIQAARAYKPEAGKTDPPKHIRIPGGES